MVFNQYCLGGSTERNLAHLATVPEGLETADGEKEFTFVDQGKTIILRSRNEITTVVTRHETPGSWINYTSWKVKLVRLYGRGKDLSSFPRYATSRSSRLNAINAGRGHAEFEWDQSHFAIKLIWDSPDFINLRYLLTTQPIESNNTEGL